MSFSCTAFRNLFSSYISKSEKHIGCFANLTMKTICTAYRYSKVIFISEVNHQGQRLQTADRSIEDNPFGRTIKTRGLISRIREVFRSVAETPALLRTRGDICGQSLQGWKGATRLAGALSSRPGPAIDCGNAQCREERVQPQPVVPAARCVTVWA